MFAVLDQGFRAAVDEYFDQGLLAVGEPIREVRWKTRSLTQLAPGR
ncbi:hypothetical protein ACFC1L_43290 [Streptomyces sp. NPDC056210]